MAHNVLRLCLVPYLKTKHNKYKLIFKFKNNMEGKNQLKALNKTDVMVSAVEYLINELDRIGKKYNIQIKAEKGWIEERNQIIKNALQKENGNK